MARILPLCLVWMGFIFRSGGEVSCLTAVRVTGLRCDEL